LLACLWGLHAAAVDVTKPGGGTIAGSPTHATYPPANAFDNGNPTTDIYRWLPERAYLPNCYVQYRFDNGERYVVTNYTLYDETYAPAQRAPRDFQLLGSNDGATWTEVDSQTGQVSAGAGQPRSYSVRSPGSYEYYRFNISADNGGNGGYCGLSELEYHGYLGVEANNADGATGVGANSAILNGSLDYTSGATFAWAYWGPTDGGTNKAAWTNAVAFGQRPVGPLSTNVTGLAADRTYYYRFYAFNANYAAWATESLAFITAQMAFDAADAA